MGPPLDMPLCGAGAERVRKLNEWSGRGAWKKYGGVGSCGAEGGYRKRRERWAEILTAPALLTCPGYDSLRWGRHLLWRCGPTWHRRVSICGGADVPTHKMQKGHPNPNLYPTEKLCIFPRCIYALEHLQICITGMVITNKYRYWIWNSNS